MAAREETVSLNNGLPATYRICIKHIHDSGGEVVQHHCFRTGSKHMTKKDWTRINNTNATRRVSQLVPSCQQNQVRPSRAAASHVNPLSGLQHSLFSSKSKRMLSYLLSIFQDASAPPDFFQYSGSHAAFTDKTAHIVTTPGWSIICFGTLTYSREANIWPPKTSTWQLNMSEAPIPAFKCSSLDRQYGHRAAIFNLFPFWWKAEVLPGDCQSTNNRLFLNYLYFHTTTCLGTSHP